MLAVGLVSQPESKPASNKPIIGNGARVIRAASNTRQAQRVSRNIVVKASPIFIEAVRMTFARHSASISPRSASYRAAKLQKRRIVPRPGSMAVNYEMPTLKSRRRLSPWKGFYFTTRSF